MVIACGGIAPDAVITTTGFAFTPSDVTISAGQVVQFSPASTHNMTAGAPGAPTGEFATVTSMETCLRFTAAGSFPFFCSVHPTMAGTVTVQ
jgi:plastocyanin